jgi:hypothetical protein
VRRPPDALMGARRPANPERFVSASELGEYAYCRRAWWLRAVQGVTTAEQGTRFQAGRTAHQRHGVSLLLARALALAAVLALLAAALFLWRSR